MIDMLSKLPGLNDETSDDERTPEEIAADEKRARIQFHRESVRNGPTKFKTVSDGKIRRDRARATRSMIKKNRRKQVQDYLAQQRFIATLRGNLQAVGILPYATEGFTVSEVVENRALHWLASVFEGDDLEARLKDAVATYTRLTMPVKR